jgi:hypothetical protein
MATSGTTSYSVSELDIITDALANIGVAEAGQTLGADDVVLARRKLNMILKQWVGQADFAPGLKMWTRRRAFLFLQKDQYEYSIGPSGDECASESYVSTTLTAAASLGAGAVTVSSITGLATAMRVGILLASGSFQWTTINGAPSGSTVTLTATLTGAAASGARLFAYTSKPLRPFEIVSAVRRDTSGDDVPMDPHMSVGEYEVIPSKAEDGTPSRFYFEAKKTNAKVYLECAPDEVTDVVRLVYLSYVEDSTATSDDVDFPAEWFRPLSAQLSIDCCLPFSRPVDPALKLIRDESLAMARNAYPATSEAFYQSEPDSY